MLNAFRHQRTVHAICDSATYDSGNVCSTPFGINELFTDISSANSFRSAGAQRLSASTNCSQHIKNSLAFRLRVLNAFRHQRTVHPEGSSIDQSGSSAQRLSASTNCSPRQAAEPRCSSVVLNAFRHQRTVHGGSDVESGSRDGGAQRLSASTNCSRRYVPMFKPFNECAQRLSASTNCSPRPCRRG